MLRCRKKAKKQQFHYILISQSLDGSAGLPEDNNQTLYGDNKLTFDPPTHFARIEPKLNQVVPWSLATPSLKISCKSVQPFSRNLADKETNIQTNKERNKQRYKQRNRSKTVPPSPYRGRGKNNNTVVRSDSTQKLMRQCAIT